MKTLGRLYMFWCCVFISLPIVVVCSAALNSGRTMNFPPRQPNFQRFMDFFVNEPVWINSLQNSVVIAFVSAALATLLAWPLAYGVWLRNDSVSRALCGIAALPFVLPPIIFGVGVSFLWTFSGFLGNFWIGALSHSILHLALPVVTISIGLNSIDRSHLDAAATMGAEDGTILRTIVFPQTLSYTVSGFFFALVLSFNEFIVMFFVSASSYSTVTLQIFNSLRNGFTPTMAVAAVVFIVVSIIVFSLVARWGDLPRLMGADQTKT